MWGRERNILMVSGEQPSPGLKPGFLAAAGLRLTQAVVDTGVLDLARRARFDLIILDLPAPCEPGLELCRKLKGEATTRSTPLVVVAIDAAVASARALGAEAVVRRPIVAREYHEAVGRFVRLPKRRVKRQLVNLRIAYELEGSAGQAFTRDLSPCGAFLKTDRAPEVGASMSVHFAIPGDARPVRCQAIVRRIARLDDEPPGTGFAIEFCGMDETDAERLDRFLGRP
jgi:CheY-like chemotaxis protein